jgi:hypothetical protein
MANERTKTIALKDLGEAVTGKTLSCTDADTVVSMIDKITAEYSGGDPKADEYTQNAYDVCEEKGATMPEEKTLANLADCIESIPSATIIPPEAGTLTGIVVGTYPTKTVYTEGEELDLSGLTIIATYSNSYEYDVTNNCTYTVNNPVTYYDTKIVVTYETSTLDIPITVNGIPVLIPEGTRALYHLDGNLKNEITGTNASGTYTPITGKFENAQGARGVAFVDSGVPNAITTPACTMEFWIKPVNKGYPIYAAKNSGTSGSIIMITGRNEFDPSAHSPYMGDEFCITGTHTSVATLPSWDLNIWHHVAITFSFGIWTMFIDGKKLSYGPLKSDVTAIRYLLNAPSADSYQTYTYMDEVCTYDSIKYTTDFEPPHAPYYINN